MNSLPCFERTDRLTGKKLVSLIDTGASNNYILSKRVKHGQLIRLKNPLLVGTIHGKSEITHYVKVNLFSHSLRFFVMNYLGNFDLILGMDGLRRINAKLDLMSFELKYTSRIKSHEINFNIQENVDNDIKNMIAKMIEVNNDTPTLPFNTKVKATIRTTTSIPIWTKQFAYPMSCNDFVNNEIEKLLKQGIIKLSHSPYNSPLWVVPKKGFNEDGSPKKRLVIDFSKLNSFTIFDRYPMPNIDIILTNLGEAQFFSKIDLEAGFHQISIQESDREKTAFSVNGAKYEFTRLPFGLKNAPSIFQRAIDDILRAFIGKFAYVYMDDVIIFSKTEEEHLNHLTKVIEAFTAANMRISSEKSSFFEKKIEFLGHIISQGRITVDPQKIEAIKNYVLPSTLKQLRSFLGLSGHYRKFVRGYAETSKPLTLYLGEQNGKVGAKSSSKVKIQLNDDAIKAFNLIKSKMQEQLELFQPDYSKRFELTTDASNFAIGGVLSQNGKPITFISRTLSKTEMELATNERELLAIVWALKTLRNYLYGIADLTVFTDHQPLTLAVSEKNPNLQIKRWKSFVEESGVRLQYKPGKENIVADALSRQYCFLAEDLSSSSDSIHSTQSSPEAEIIRKVSFPLNFYKNQFNVEKSSENELKTQQVFPGYVLHNIKFSNHHDLIRNFTFAVREKTVNAIYSTEEIYFEIRQLLRDNFPQINFVFTSTKNRNITDENEQEYLIVTEHERAHRNFRENYAQIKEKYFFPKMRERIKTNAVNCEICKKQKYDTHPRKQVLNETPIPNSVGQYLQMDIFHAGKKLYYSTIDRFSKFVIFRYAQNKLNAHEVVEEILQLSPSCEHVEYVMTDNELIFNSFPMKSLFRRKGIQHSLTPVQHSTSNAQIERFHRTVIEIARCLAEQRSLAFEDVVFDSIREYNNTIHSVIQAKPIDVFFHSENYPHIPELIKKAQKNMISFQNKNRDVKHFNRGDIIFAKNDRRDKRSPAFIKHVVKEDRGMNIISDKDKKIHKDNIKK